MEECELRPTMDDPLVFILCVINLLMSNLLSWPVRLFLASRPPLSHTIITVLNAGLVLAYNLHTVLLSLLLLVRAALGPFPAAAAIGGQFLFGFATLCLVGLHLALAAVRYLSVTWFSRIHPADYQRLARRIYITIGGIALVLIAAIMPIRASAEKTRNIESYLLGVAAPGINQMRYPLGFGGAALLGMGVSYLVCKRILQRRALARYL